jgi:hypothetical protein
LKCLICSSDSGSAKSWIESLIRSSWTRRVEWKVPWTSLASSWLIGWFGASLRARSAYWRTLLCRRVLGASLGPQADRVPPVAGHQLQADPPTQRCQRQTAGQGHLRPKIIWHIFSGTVRQSPTVEGVVGGV